jgi:hypothetical protein
MDESMRSSAVADRVQAYSEQARTTAADATQRLADAADRTSEWAVEKSRGVNAVSDRLLGSVCDAIEARPLLALGIAILVGYAVSRVPSRD